MADQEISLIDKVELRIALASTDDKFQAALDLYLCPLLLKLSSPHATVRQHILKFIQGIIPRLNGSRSVQLPTLKLIEQAQAPKSPQGQDPATVQLYSLLFASKGIDRMGDASKNELTPIIVKGISTFSTAVAARMFYLFCKSLKSWKSPDRGTDEYKDLRAKLALTPEDEQFIIRKIETLLMLVPAVNNDGVVPRGYTCQGLSAADVSFLTHEAGIVYKPDDLASVKKDVASFITMFQDKYIMTLLEIGAADSHNDIANACAALLRKITIPYEDEGAINHMIDLFIGNKTLPRSSVKAVVQERFLQVFNRSVIATKHKAIPLITSMGLNAQKNRKIKSSTITLIQWVAKNGSDSLVSDDYAMNVAAQVRNNLHSEGWPRFEVVQGTNYRNELQHRMLQYEALGDVLKKHVSLVQDFSYMEFLFDSLVGDIAEVRPTIQAALGSLTIHLPTLPEASKFRMKALMKSYLQEDDTSDIEPEALHAVRYTALKYINAAFPFSDPEARMINIMGTSSKNRSDLVEEAQKGLNPYWFNILQSTNTNEIKATPELLGIGKVLKFPQFEDMVEELSKSIEYAKGMDSATLRHSFSTAVEFTLRVLVSQAIHDKPTVIVQDQEWATRLDKGLEHDDNVIELVKAELAKVSDLTDFLDILRAELVANGSKDAITPVSNPNFGKIFLRLLSLSPQSIVQSQVPSVMSLLGLIQKNSTTKDSIVDYAANAMGIIASHPAFTDVQILSLYADLQNSLNIIGTGRTLLLGYLVSRLLLRSRYVFSGAVLRDVYTFIADQLSSTDVRTSHAAVVAVGELAKFGGFGPTVNSEFIGLLKARIIENLEPKVKKLNEASMISWALLSLSEEESIEEEFTKYETVIYETHNTKQVESLFTSGEAFTIIASGWDTKYLKQKRDIQDTSMVPSVASRNDRLDFILTKVLAACSSTRPTLRKAGCIWLLSLAQYCGHLQAVSGKAGLIHVAFMRFLSDRDELVQEAASRGLSIVYELGNNDLKETLVKSLLRSFTESRATAKLSAGSVSADTELFEPGVLKTNDGSVSTYKDILNLASEVGDPSLVYKFMSMAKSSALWSSRKGIAFGLGAIMSKSSLDKMLFENATLSNRLIPKLYRYRFDPSPSVSKSMNDIWSSIVPDTTKAVETYYESILKELINGMGNKEWRVREASTFALNDLIQILPNEKYQDRMEEIWTMGFRSIDDIKDSVRAAGGGLTRTLSQIFVNSISVESGSSISRAKQQLTTLIPFLLGSKGIQSDAEDVRDFALRTILNLVKKAGKAIRPFIPDLLEQFILLMSTLEPQVINYLALNADKYNLKSDDIDAKRLQGLGSSPMMNALEKLVDLIDDGIMGDVVSRLQSTVKKSVGLPSKAAASRVMVTLVIRHLHVVQPYGETLLNTCITQLKGRNTTVSSSFATAAGYMCRVSSIETTVKYAEKIRDMYFDSEDEKTKIVAGIASEAVSKHSGDRFASVASAFLPVAFIARNDPSKDVAKAFESEWSENTSGNGAIKLYMHEICDLTEKCMASGQFSIRQTAAKSIAIACEALDASSSTTFNVQRLFDVLITASQGRSWSGKEDVTDALVSLAVKSKSYVISHSELLEKVNKIVITEAKRRNKDYQKHAIVSLGKFAHEYPTEDLQRDVLSIFESILSPDHYDSDDDDDDDNEKGKTIDSVSEKSSPKNLKKEADRMRTLSSLTESFQCHSDGIYYEEFLHFILEKLIKTLNPVVYIPTWRSQLAVVEGLIKISTALKGITLTQSTISQFEKTWSDVMNSNTHPNVVENVKVQTVRAASSINAIGNTTLTDMIKASLTGYQQSETNQVVLVEIKNALTTTTI